MAKYADIQKILDDSVNNDYIRRHGAFWRKQNRDQFVEHKVYGCPLIHKEGDRFVGVESSLVKILRGPLDCGTGPMPLMPRGYRRLSEENIQFISDWIDEQCPE